MSRARTKWTGDPSSTRSPARGRVGCSWRRWRPSVAAYLEAHHDERDDAGHALVVRNGKGRRRKVTLARLQERQTAAMHGLSRQLASARGVDEIVEIAVKYIAEIFDGQVLGILPDEKRKLHVAAGRQRGATRRSERPMLCLAPLCTLAAWRYPA